MTHKQAQRLFRKWTTILGFHGWKIECYTSAEEYISRDSYQTGVMEEYGPYPQATIRIALAQGGEDDDENIEYVIVHELLHAKLIPLNGEHDRVCKLLGAEASKLAYASWHDTQEFLVESFAKSLLEAYGYGN